MSFSRTSSLRRSSTRSSSVITREISAATRAGSSTSSFSSPTRVLTILREMNSISSGGGRIVEGGGCDPGGDIRAPAIPLHVVRHPLVDDVLASLRDKTTASDEFRRLARRLSLLVIAEATKALPLAEATVETPLETAAVRRLANPGGGGRGGAAG